jgi:NAD(P)-dependent dehydrogenase (short-subunit alcohol dehydrogenase family)
MAWTLVTPSSRGIGAALTRRLLQTTPASLPIIATARSNLDVVKSQLLDGTDSKHHSRLDVQKVDFNSESSIADLSAYCKDRYNNKDKDKTAHLRLAFMVPGMLAPEKAPEKIDYDSALATLKLNLLAPMLLIKHFSRFLPRKSAKLEPIDGLNDSAILALMCARVGSITDNGRGGWYSYRSSKAGVAQLVKTLDNLLKVQSGSNAISVGLHPGTVKTGLSEEFWASTPKDDLFEPEFSAEKLVDVVKGLRVEVGRGKVWDWKATVVPP